MAGLAGSFVTETWPAIPEISEPGRLADVITHHLRFPFTDKQTLLRPRREMLYG